MHASSDVRRWVQWGAWARESWGAWARESWGEWARRVQARVVYFEVGVGLKLLVLQWTS